MKNKEPIYIAIAVLVFVGFRVGVNFMSRGVNSDIRAYRQPTSTLDGDPANDRRRLELSIKTGHVLTEKSLF